MKETTSWTNSSGEFPEKLLLLKKSPLNSSPSPTKNSTCMIETLRCMHYRRKGLVFPHSFPLSQSSQMTALMQLHLHLRKDSCCPRGPTMTEMLSRQLVCLLQAQSSCCLLLRLRHRSSNTLDPPLKHTSLLPQWTFWTASILSKFVRKGDRLKICTSREGERERNQSWVVLFTILIVSQSVFFKRILNDESRIS